MRLTISPQVRYISKRLGDFKCCEHPFGVIDIFLYVASDTSLQYTQKQDNTNIVFNCFKSLVIITAYFIQIICKIHDARKSLTESINVEHRDFLKVKTIFLSIFDTFIPNQSSITDKQ